jgi:nitrogen fixation NifU-like protein
MLPPNRIHATIAPITSGTLPGYWHIDCLYDRRAVNMPRSSPGVFLNNTSYGSKVLMNQGEFMAEPPNKEERPESSGPVLFYNDAVIDHFVNPRNVGELDEAETDGYGLVGDPSCGDQMKLWISVRSSRIDKIAFKSFGCPGAIATSSMLTHLAKGKTIEEAKQITDDDVIEALGGIPERKRHCSLLGVLALQAAIRDWERRLIDAEERES